MGYVEVNGRVVGYLEESGQRVNASMKVKVKGGFGAI